MVEKSLAWVVGLLLKIRRTEGSQERNERFTADEW
jgi:hypothetical protein